MEIIVGVIILVIIVFAIGTAKGAPEATSMTREQIAARMQSEGAWIEKYKSLPYENQQGEGIKKQYKDKTIYMAELQLQFMQLGIDDEQETLIPILQRSIQLMKQGMSEEKANEQASNEYVAKRDADNASAQDKT